MVTRHGFICNPDDIDSSLNSLGHRSPEIEQTLGYHLTFKKYFLVIGDNPGLHFHYPLEETWPYLLHHSIQHNFYNLCVRNGGIDVARHNLGVWLAKYGKPKMVFIASDWANAFYGIQYTEAIRDAEKLGDVTGYHLGRQMLFSSLVKTISAHVPFYQLVHPGTTPMIHGDHITNIYTDVNDDYSVCKIITKMLNEKEKARAV